MRSIVAATIAREKAILSDALLDLLPVTLERWRIETRALLDRFRATGRSVWMYGGSAKAATFVNAVGIDERDIAFCANSTEEKIGKFLPGTGIEIRTEAEAIDARPDYYLVTAWNYRNELIQKVRAGGNAHSGFAVPFPEVQIIVTSAADIYAPSRGQPVGQGGGVAAGPGRRGPGRRGEEAMTEISVIIACLNGAETLAEALDSLAAQRWDRPWEIVFADNGSTDASVAIFAEHAARHPEVAMRLVDASARRGKAHALNLAIRAAAGRSLLFCDADDTVAPGWLAAMGRALETHDLVAARFDLTALNPDWTLAERPHAPDRLAVLPFEPFCPVAGGATLGFHRRVFEAVGDFDPGFAAQEDTDFCIRAHRKGFAIRMVPDAVYNYRFRDTPEAIYRQAYAYSRAEALLRRRHMAEPRFLAPRPWLSLASRSARLSAEWLKARALRRERSLLERARFNRRLGTAMGILAGSLAYARRAAHPRGAAAAGQPLLHPLLRRLYGSTFAVATDERLMALTFDDGPDPEHTPRLLEVLARHGAKATFFMVGARAARHPELVARVAAEGHEIGNHGWDHPSLPALPSAAVAEQLERTRAVLAPHGQALMRPALRPPGPPDPPHRPAARLPPGVLEHHRRGLARPRRRDDRRAHPRPGGAGVDRAAARLALRLGGGGVPRPERLLRRGRDAARAAARLPLRHGLGAAPPRRGAPALLGAAPRPRRHGAAAPGGGKRGAMTDGGRVRVGISGSGFVARALAAVLARTPDFAVTGVLTRRPVAFSADHFPEGVLTNSTEALIERADIVFECSGDTIHAAEVLVAAGEAGRRLVTMNAEAQVTVGTELLHMRLFDHRGARRPARGAAELDAEVRAIGFEPVAYVNLKGFHDPDPSRESMLYWSEKQKSTLSAVTSYTDGGKMQIEQVLVANGLGAGIARQGMIGGAVDDLLELGYLAAEATRIGRPVSDYVVHPKGPKGVLVLATSEDAELTPDYSVFSKVRTHDGRAYMLLKPHYFVHVEVPKTLRGVMAGAPPVITNALAPTVSIAAVAKRALGPGTRIETGLGGFEFRGEAVTIAEHPDAVPITLLDGAVTRHALDAGAIVTEADVDVPDTLAHQLWMRTAARVLKGSHAAWRLPSARWLASSSPPTGRSTSCAPRSRPPSPRPGRRSRSCSPTTAAPTAPLPSCRRWPPPTRGRTG